MFGAMMFGHRQQIRYSGRPYVNHLFDVVGINRELFKSTDPLMDAIAAAHDVYEDQRRFFFGLNHRLSYEALSKRGMDQLKRWKMGVYILSELGLESRPNYFLRIANPYREWSSSFFDTEHEDHFIKEMRTLTATKPRWLNNNFIHGIQLIKLSDVLANVQDLPDTTDQDFPRRFLEKTFREFFPYFFLQKNLLTDEEKRIFLQKFESILSGFEQFNGRPELKKAVVYARVELAKVKALMGEDQAMRTATGELNYGFFRPLLHLARSNGNTFDQVVDSMRNGPALKSVEIENLRKLYELELLSAHEGVSFGLRSGGYSLDRDKFFRGILSGLTFPSNADEQRIINALVRMTPGALTMVEIMGVLTAKEVDFFMQEKLSEANINLFEDKEDFQRRMATFMAHNNADEKLSVTNRTVLMQKLVPIEWVDIISSYLGVSRNRVMQVIVKQDNYLGWLFKAVDTIRRTTKKDVGRIEEKDNEGYLWRVLLLHGLEHADRDIAKAREEVIKWVTYEKKSRPTAWELVLTNNFVGLDRYMNLDEFLGWFNAHIVLFPHVGVKIRNAFTNQMHELRENGIEKIGDFEDKDKKAAARQILFSNGNFSDGSWDALMGILEPLMADAAMMDEYDDDRLFLRNELSALFVKAGWNERTGRVTITRNGKTETLGIKITNGKKYLNAVMHFDGEHITGPVLSSEENGTNFSSREKMIAVKLLIILGYRFAWRRIQNPDTYIVFSRVNPGMAEKLKIIFKGEHNPRLVEGIEQLEKRKKLSFKLSEVDWTRFENTLYERPMQRRDFLRWGGAILGGLGATSAAVLFVNQYMDSPVHYKVGQEGLIDASSMLSKTTIGLYGSRGIELETIDVKVEEIKPDPRNPNILIVTLKTTERYLGQFIKKDFYIEQGKKIPGLELSIDKAMADWDKAMISKGAILGSLVALSVVSGAASQIPFGQIGNFMGSKFDTSITYEVGQTGTYYVTSELMGRETILREIKTRVVVVEPDPDRPGNVKVYLGASVGSKKGSFAFSITPGSPVRNFTLDQAQNSVQTSPGGIDFNSANMAMTIKRDGQGMPLPFANQDLSQLSHIQGFEAEILEIVPVSGLLPILSELRQKKSSFSIN